MKLWFLLMLFAACCRLSGLVSEGSEVTGSVGEDVILPCLLKPPFNVHKLFVEWKRNGTAVHTYRSREDDPDSQDETFKNRTRLFHDEMFKGNISLKLFNVTEQDKGVYTCSVRIGLRLVKEENITLKIVPKGKEDRIEDDPKNNLSTADISGIVVGVIAFIVIGILICIVIKCQRGQQQETPNNAELETLNSGQNN